MTARPFEVESTESRRERAVLVGIDRRDPNWPLAESLAELERLANTAGADVVGVTSQRLESPNPRTFVGSGKVDEIRELAASAEADIVIFDDELTPSQQNNLEKAVKDCKIIDRTALILDIFALHATTREGRLQVRLAQNQYLYPRLRGMWSHLASNRMGGGVGSRFGEGESQLEVDRRMVRKRIDKIKQELAKLGRDREVQRNRRYSDGVCKAVLVGYTNAGKSTTLNALTGAGVLAEDKLFATLDSTTRGYVLPEGRKITLTDTVGFIQKLPTTLVEAFKSTLDEVIGSDLVLHICDASSAKMDSQYAAVQGVLEQIGAVSIPSITVFNKVDLLPTPALEALKRRYPSAICVSAKEGVGLDELVSRISQACSSADRAMTVLLPYSKGSLVELAHERCTVASISYLDNGVEMTLRCPAGLVSRFDGYAVSGNSVSSDDVAAPDDLTCDAVGFQADRIEGETLPMEVQLLGDDACAPEPVPATSNAFLLRSSEDVRIAPFERKQVPTGVCVALPPKTAGLAIPRNALYDQDALGFANSPGLIDNGYRGELKFVAVNHDAENALKIAANEPVGYVVVMRTVMKDDFSGDATPGGSLAIGLDREVAEDISSEGDIMQVPVRIVPIDNNMQTPSYAHDSDNGIDLRSAEAFDLEPHQRRCVGFGIALELADGCVAFVQPRSGLALREGLSIADTPSLVTADRQGAELQAVFVNLDNQKTVHVEKGDRIAQLVVMEAPRIRIELAEELDDTDRGAGGFGSSGIG